MSAAAALGGWVTAGTAAGIAAAMMLALRRMRVAAFGTLMALEPGIATLLGLLVLMQRPDLLQVISVIAVVAAGIGAQRSSPPSPRPACADQTPPGELSSRSGCSDVGGVDAGQSAASSADVTAVTRRKSSFSAASDPSAAE